MAEQKGGTATALHVADLDALGGRASSGTGWTARAPMAGRRCPTPTDSAEGSAYGV